MAEENIMEQKHFVLVHGAGHGAWCWYKIKPRLESKGHKVTALDLAGCGISTKTIEQVQSFSEYSEPLLKLLNSLDQDEKVVLVGHSFGGMSIALAMDKFPEKISVGIFLAAFIPDTLHKPSHVLEKYIKIYPAIAWLDSDYSPSGGKMLLLFGPNALSNKFYQLCSAEDLELGKSLIRRGSLFVEELSERENFSREGYGCVPRAYIVCEKDLSIPIEHQKWMIKNAEIDEVVEMKDSDHMPMFCKPQELCSFLIEIADKHA